MLLINLQRLSHSLLYLYGMWMHYSFLNHFVLYWQIISNILQLQIRLQWRILSICIFVLLEQIFRVKCHNAMLGQKCKSCFVRYLAKSFQSFCYSNLYSHQQCTVRGHRHFSDRKKTLLVTTYSNLLLL